MKHLLREYLTLSSRERNGVLALLGIILLLFVLLGASKYFVKKQKYDFTAFEKEVNAFNAKQEEETEQTFAVESKSRSAHSTQRFLFDPNTATEQELRDLGLSSKQIKAVIGFRAHGGFSSKEEFEKVKAIPHELYASLEPYILIPGRTESPGPSALEKKMIPLNAADSVSLLGIEGVHPFLVKKILRLRNALGGFISKQQLMEVRGMDEKKFALICAHTTLDTTDIEKINVNTCTVEDLSLHPYISYHVARALVNYREVHGRFKALSEVRGCDLVNDELYSKIVSYLTVDQ